jgi:3-dehydroquinate dehydratase II
MHFFILCMKKILILNGPNLNLTGIREPEIYGDEGFDTIIDAIKQRFPHVELFYHQSNVEGELINLLHDYGFRVDGIVINPGGYSHTSVAIADAIRAITAKVVEVHLSNVYLREHYRQTMITAAACEAIVSGMGMKSYIAAVSYLLEKD